MSRPLLCVAILTALALAGAGCRKGAERGEQPADRLLDMDGRRIDPFQELGERAGVFVFTRTDCPISNRYAPELRRLHDRFAGRGVSFRLVYVDPDQDAATIRQHLAEFGYPMPALRDPEHALVAMTGARVTPEVAVFGRRGTGHELIYRGRVDDWYVDFGRSRAEPSTRDLEISLEAILARRPVPRARTPAVGCFIADLA